MSIEARTTYALTRWKEPTREQWMAWITAWLGWTLDAFDFTIFLLIMVPIAQTFHVPLVAVTSVFRVLRLLGATESGWLADRGGRKVPLMISIAWYSVCNFIAAFSPTFWSYFCFARFWGSARARGGQQARRWRWKVGRRPRVGS